MRGLQSPIAGPNGTQKMASHPGGLGGDWPGRPDMSADDQSELFSEPEPGRPPARRRAGRPAARRPDEAAPLSEVVGQDHILGPGSLLARLVAQNRFGSLLFYGPPGTGRRASPRRSPGRRAAASCASTRSCPTSPSCATSWRRAAPRPGAGTILFIDELHRFNKTQQDLLLPDVEEGVVRLIGATTHNPGFYINPPLLSRSHLFRLEPLSTAGGRGRPRPGAGRRERGLGALGVTADRAPRRPRGLLRRGPAARAERARGDRARQGRARRRSRRRPRGVRARAPDPLRRRTRTSTTTRSRRSSRAAADPTPTRRCTGWPRCSPAARTPGSSRAAS
jgi:hypothetical protein